MTRKSKGNDDAVGKVQQEGMAMAYLLKTNKRRLVEAIADDRGLADARATAVAKLRIKQFWAIPLTGRVVVPCPLMAMPLFLFLCEGVAKLTHGRRPRIASVGNTYRHEDVSRVAGRTH